MAEERGNSGKPESRKDSNSTANNDELLVVVNLPRDLICEATDTTSIKLSIADNDAIVTEVSQGGAVVSNSNRERRRRKKGEDADGSGGDDSDGNGVDELVKERPPLSEHSSAVNTERHAKCGHSHPDNTACGVKRSKSNASEKSSASRDATKLQRKESVKNEKKEKKKVSAKESNEQEEAGTKKRKSSKANNEEDVKSISGKLNGVVDRFDGFMTDLSEKMDKLSRRVDNLEHK